MGTRLARSGYEVFSICCREPKETDRLTDMKKKTDEVSLCVCGCVCMRACMHVYACMHVCWCVDVWVHVCRCVCVCVCIKRRSA